MKETSFVEPCNLTLLLRTVIHNFIQIWILIYLGDNPFCAVTDLHKEGLTNTTYFLPFLGNFKLEITHKYMAKQDKIDIHKIRQTKLNNH